MDTVIATDIRTVAANEWNHLQGATDPFLCHEFLAAMEAHGCVGDHYGWLPHHLLTYASDGALVGAVPAYLKFNSYGEFVFDWAWADAYQRAGLNYYPKLVVGVPYTPATGKRILVAPEADYTAVSAALIERSMEIVHSGTVSSLHWLFTDTADTQRLKEYGLARRTGCQFHWSNNGYSSFSDFLATLTSKKRKQVNRERRIVKDAGITIRIVHGNEVSHSDWNIMHDFYSSTFAKKSGIPTLSVEFFRDVSNKMGEAVVLIFAEVDNQPVAGTISFRSSNTLYGRHWGCNRDYHSLHFELCYYQGIEYCITNGLQRFEPGAQGEHKLSRGFLPTATWSAHWIEDQRFRAAIEDFLIHEHAGVTDYMNELDQHSPYKICDNRLASTSGPVL